MVTNAGCRDSDLQYIAQQMQDFNDVEHEVLDGWGILAVQGPRAAEVLQKVVKEDLGKIKFGMAAYIGFSNGDKYHVARGGYTGEDGFEVCFCLYFLHDSQRINTYLFD